MTQFNAFLQGQQARSNRMRMNAFQEEQERASDARQREQGLANTRGKIQNAFMQPNMDREQIQGMAANSGDADIMESVRTRFASMDQAQQERAAMSLETMGAVSGFLLDQPYETRMELIQSPRILENLNGMGYSAEDIASFDPTDEALGLIRSQTQAARAAMAENMQDFTLGTNDSRIDATTGQQTIGRAGSEARGIDRANADTRRLQADTAAARERREATQPQQQPNYRTVGGSLYDLADPANPQVVIQASEFSPTETRQHRQQAQQTAAIQGALDDYRERLRNVGTNVIYNPRNPDIAGLEAARTGLLMQVKELFNLGVLTGPDMDIIEGAIGDPTGQGAIGNSTESLLAQLGVVEDYLNRTRNQIPAEFRGAPEDVSSVGDINELIDRYAPEQ